MAIRRKLVAASPANADFQRDLAVSHDNLFVFLAGEQQPPAAVEYLLTSLRIMLPLVQRGALPNPADQQLLMSRLELAKKWGLFDESAEES